MIKLLNIKIAAVFEFVFLLALFSVSASTIFGQKAVDDTPTILPSNSVGEENSAITDYIANEARQTGERLFVIVRLGNGEINPRLNYSRLLKVKLFMRMNKGFNEKNSVFAEGERTTGEGRIEYYLGSTLKLITLAPRNKMPYLTCCEDYFPPVKRKPKRKKRKA